MLSCEGKCDYMQIQIDGLKERIDGLEYKEIKSLKEKIGEIDKRVSVRDYQVEVNEKLTEKISETMDSIKETMVVMSQNMKATGDNVSKLQEDFKINGNEFSQRFKEIETSIESTNKRILEVDDKGKVDTVGIQKRGIESVLYNAIVGGVIGAILVWALGLI